jgi:hypothetical protein
MVAELNAKNGIINSLDAKLAAVDRAIEEESNGDDPRHEAFTARVFSLIPHRNASV